VILEVCDPAHGTHVNMPDRYTQREGHRGRCLLALPVGVQACLCRCSCVCVCLLLSVADTFCAHSHQQMPPDCSRNNQLYMPNLMSRGQIRGRIRIPGPQRTALPFGLKEQFHRGRQPGTQLVPLWLVPRTSHPKALASLLCDSQGRRPEGTEDLTLLPLFLCLGRVFPTQGGAHRD
jgi:hypothetical protein